jgi:GNAT superfamily N-acetyltransferase
MPINQLVKIGPLKPGELPEAEQIFRLAFAKFLGFPNPLEFMAGQNLITPRWRSSHVKVIAARAEGRLVGSNVITRWGSFAFFGPLTVLPEYWGQGVAQRLLEATLTLFDRWGVRNSGLFTFAQSAQHVALYQKFGYWPGHLTAVLTRTPEADPANRTDAPTLLSALSRSQRQAAIEACAKLTGKIASGLDLTGEIKSLLAQRAGDVVLTYGRGSLDGFAVCVHGPGTEAADKICYVKFGAARHGADSGGRFDKLLQACDAFAAARGAALEAGVNLARQDAFLRMRAHGYRATMQGVAMLRPTTGSFNRPDAYVIDDWR